MHQNTTFQVKILFFLGRGHIPIPRPPIGRVTPSAHPTTNKSFGSACVPQNSSQIYATACRQSA